MEYCTSTCGTYRCGREDGHAGLHAAISGQSVTRRNAVRVLKWGPGVREHTVLVTIDLS